jgi:hypothetical protein
VKKKVFGVAFYLSFYLMDETQFKKERPKLRSLKQALAFPNKIVRWYNFFKLF